MLAVELLFYALFVAAVSARSIRSAENDVVSAGCSCDSRYWAHYFARGCHPVYSEGNSYCPVRFECPANASQRNDSEGCIFRGKHYDFGSSVEVGICHPCSCSQTYQGIACPYVECPESFFPPEDGCYSVYERDSCCAVRTECEPENRTTCGWNGKVHRLGQKIYPEEDHCLVCVCTEDWDGITSESCRKIDCLLDLEEESFEQRGCVPVYHESTCCPIEHICPEVDPDPSAVRDPDKCYFGRNAYNKSEVLDRDASIPECVTCTCCVPPDFTCIKRSCTQRIQNETLDDAPEEKETVTITKPAERSCEGVSCEEGERCELKEICEDSICSSFPKCVPLLDRDCPTPVCETGCFVEDVKDKCPTCVCGNSSEHDGASEEREIVTIGAPAESPCDDISCEEGEHCELKEICKESVCSVFPKCVPVLKLDCPTPLCATGCFVVHVKNECPTCACGDIKEKDVCILPNCTGRNCHFVSNKDGCPVCSCDPPCPVCPPGCKAETDIPEGRCPECICNDVNGTNNESCPKPSCHGFDCIMKTDEHNCTICACKQCFPPDCSSIGCKLVHDESAFCGRCECPPTTGDLSSDPETETPSTTETSPVPSSTTPSTAETPLCPLPLCRGYNCRIFIGSDGCQHCTCESKCPPTKCIPGCFVDTNPLPDQCPGCICHVAALNKDLTSNESEK